MYRKSVIMLMFVMMFGVNSYAGKGILRWLCCCCDCDDNVVEYDRIPEHDRIEDRSLYY